MSDSSDQLAIRVTGLEDAQRNPGLSRVVGTVVSVSEESVTLNACDNSTISVAVPPQGELGAGGASSLFNNGDKVELGIGHEGGQFVLLFHVKLSDNMDMDTYCQVVKQCAKHPQLTMP